MKRLFLTIRQALNYIGYALTTVIPPQAQSQLKKTANVLKESIKGLAGVFIEQFLFQPNVRPLSFDVSELLTNVLWRPQLSITVSSFINILSSAVHQLYYTKKLTCLSINECDQFKKKMEQLEIWYGRLQNILVTPKQDRTQTAQQTHDYDRCFLNSVAERRCTATRAERAAEAVSSFD